MTTLFDTHAHLDFPDFAADLPAVLARAEAAGVADIVTIGAGDGLGASARAVALAVAHEPVWAAVGVHPHDARLFAADDLPRLFELARRPKVVALGEIGLDYVKEYSPRAAQLALFRDQLRLARELELPVVIHDREAHEDTLRALQDVGVGPRGGIMHCFSGDAAFALTLVAMGFYISVPGVITFANAKVLPEAARAVPLDRLLLETDCPFLAPVPHRGRRNEPAYVRFTAEALARVRGESLARIAEATTSNARRVFGLAPQVP
jgi:TatD DNase family protein